jgi:predicted alpha/beta hydrolase family esterase
MRQQIFVIHGGDAFDVYEEWLTYLRSKEINLERAKLRDWKARLEETLGEDFEVIFPRMPNSQNAKYEEWKIWFEKHIPFLHDGVILIGHSLGGVFLARYLSEETFPKSIKATLLIASPFDVDGGRPMQGGFCVGESLSKLKEQGGVVVLYHSQDDSVVAFSEMTKYSALLSSAELRVFEDRGHFNQEEFPEILEEIRAISKKSD